MVSTMVVTSHKGVICVPPNSQGSFALGDDDDDKFDTKWIYLCRHEWIALLLMGLFALDDNDVTTSNCSTMTSS